MKVLFIDDEPLIRKGLQVIIPWSNYGFTDFFEAEDGLEGLRIIENENPDLVLLDIHMEKMSGLSLAKQVRENDFSGRIIILSGYSDFEYAKSAIDYGVTSYLLKPVDPDLLTEAVLKAIDEMHKEQLISIYSDQPAHLAKNRILSDILLGNMTYTPEIAQVYHLSLDSAYYQLAAISFEKGSTPAQYEFLELFERNYLSVRMSDTLLILILTSHTMMQAVQKQLVSTTVYDNSPPFIAVISSPAGSRDSLKELYKETEQYLQNIYYYKERQSNLLLADLLQQNQQVSADLNLITFTETLLQQVLLLQNSEIEQSVKSLLQYFILRKPPRDSIYFILLNCYTQVVSRLFPEYPKLEYELADEEQFKARLYADTYLCDSIAYFNSQFQKAIAFIKDASQASPCQRICQYIDAHLDSPLKLESIADMFGYNSAYLGKLFAKETGEHFNTYLDRRRIELAKEHLKKGASILQTCELSGFTNTDYFTKKFKKYVGMLPSEYRKMHF